MNQIPKKLSSLKKNAYPTKPWLQTLVERKSKKLNKPIASATAKNSLTDLHNDLEYLIELETAKRVQEAEELNG